MPLYAVSMSSVPVDTFLIDHLSGVRALLPLGVAVLLVTGSLNVCFLPVFHFSTRQFLSLRCFHVVWHGHDGFSLRLSLF